MYCPSLDLFCFVVDCAAVRHLCTPSRGAPRVLLQRHIATRPHAMLVTCHATAVVLSHPASYLLAVLPVYVLQLWVYVYKGAAIGGDII